MYEYGCFIAFWGNFDLVMEALICHLSEDDAVTNCQRINKFPSGKKHKRLARLLEGLAPHTKVALDRVFAVARRNDWVHGVVLNPHGDFSVLTLFRATNQPFSVTKFPIDTRSSPFDEFYEKCEQFVNGVDGALRINTMDIANKYLRELQDR